MEAGGSEVKWAEGTTRERARLVHARALDLSKQLKEIIISDTRLHKITWEHTREITELFSI